MKSKHSVYADVVEALLTQRALVRKQLTKLDRRIEYYIAKMKEARSEVQQDSIAADDPAK